MYTRKFCPDPQDFDYNLQSQIDTQNINEWHYYVFQTLLKISIALRIYTTKIVMLNLDN